MCEEFSYQMIDIFNCQSNGYFLLFEENMSVGGSEQRRDALFKIHLRETWLELLRLL